MKQEKQKQNLFDKFGARLLSQFLKDGDSGKTTEVITRNE
jgi:hypothetical protein